MLERTQTILTISNMIPITQKSLWLHIETFLATFKYS